MGSVITMSEVEAVDALLTAEDVAQKLKVSKDWVWDHSSRRVPYLPVIRMSDGALRYRASGIDEFLKERERASVCGASAARMEMARLFLPHRNRGMNGKLVSERVGPVRGKKWYGNFRRTVIDPETNEPKTVISPVVLGLKSEMSKSEARENLKARSRDWRTTRGRRSRQKRHRHLWVVCPQPLSATERGRLERGNREGQEALIQADLIDAFDDVRLENFEKFTLQRHLNQLAKTRSRIECCRSDPTCGPSSLRQSTRATSRKTPHEGQDSGKPSPGR